MVRGLDDGLLRDLWNFPAAFGASPADALAHLEAKLHHLTRAHFAVAEPVAKFRHGITYRSIQGLVYPLEGITAGTPGHWRWFELSRLPQAAISQVARKVIANISSC